MGCLAAFRSIVAWGLCALALTGPAYAQSRPARDGSPVSPPGTNNRSPAGASTRANRSTASRPAAPIKERSPENAPRRVTEVVDGVTFYVEGASSAVRLAGALVPPADVGAGQRAAGFLSALLVGEEVLIEELPQLRGDRSRGPQPPAARLDARRSDEQTIAAIVFRAPDGLCVNVEAVRQGFARFDDDHELRIAGDLITAEALARRARKGIWTDRPPPPSGDAERAPPAPGEEPEARELRDEPAVRSATGSSEKSKAEKLLVYITRSGTRYHLRDCAHCRGGATSITLAEARKREMKPCSQCKPPE